MAVRPLPLPALVEANQTRSHWCHSWPQPVHMEISSPAGKTEPKTGSQKPSLFQNGLLDYSRLVIRRIRRMACDNPQYIGLLVSLTFTNKILTSAHFTFSSSEPKKEDKYFKMGCIIILYIYTHIHIYIYTYITYLSTIATPSLVDAEKLDTKSKTAPRCHAVPSPPRTEWIHRPGADMFDGKDIDFRTLKKRKS